jgi:hypothetical protein
LKNFEQTLIKIFQPDFDLKNFIAIMIAIENFSGLIRDRFLQGNRAVIFPENHHDKIGCDAPGGSAEALPPPRGHPPALRGCRITGPAI